MASVVTKQPNDNIADDWQDVTELTDDTFSIISLTISEDSQDEEDEADDTSKSTTLLSLSSRNAGATKDDGKYYEDRLSDVDTAGNDEKDAGLPGSAWSSTAASINDVLDADWNPPHLLKVTTSLGKLIGEIMSAISFHGNFAPIEGTKELRGECSKVRDALKTLEPIMDGYSKHWDTHQPSDYLPLDPGLYQTMSHLRIELLGLQCLLQRHMGEAHSASEADDASSGIAKYQSFLVEFNTAISGFLPILQADYDEFLAANLHVAPTNNSPACGQYETHSGPGNDASVSRLRRELYDLKDIIDACQGQFYLFIQRQAVTRDPEALQSLAKSYALIKASLGTMLSNHASEWLDYSMAGGITYHEFCQLHPDTIRSLTIQLRDVHTKLDSELYRVDSAKWMNDPDSLLGDLELEVTEGNVETLRSLEEVLCSLLRIKLASQEQAPSPKSEKNES